MAHRAAAAHLVLLPDCRHEPSRRPTDVLLARPLVTTGDGGYSRCPWRLTITLPIPPLTKLGPLPGADCSFKDMSDCTTGEAVVILLGTFVLPFIIGIIASAIFGVGLFGLLGLGALAS